MVWQKEQYSCVKRGSGNNGLVVLNFFLIIHGAPELLDDHPRTDRLELPTYLPRPLQEIIATLNRSVSSPLSYESYDAGHTVPLPDVL